MGCCKCKKHGWPDPQPIVWADPVDGKEYCVFHSPQQSKGVDDIEFNKLVLNRIRAAAKAENTRTTCNLIGTIFPGAFRVPQYDHMLSAVVIDFSGAIFCHDADFSKIAGSFLFTGAVFKGAFKCSHSRFRVLNLTECTFAGPVHCISSAIYDIQCVKTLFKGLVIFSYSDFGNPEPPVGNKVACAHFSNSSFDKRAYFNQAIFRSPIDFRYIEAPSDHIQIHSVNKESVTNTLFSSGEVCNLSFMGCRWPNRLGLEIQGNGDADNLQACEELYRAMKQKAAEAHDQHQVSRWHFREKLMQLKQLFANDRSNDLIEVVEDRDANWVERIMAWCKLLWHRPHWQKFTLTGIYWATSGFGERAVRAGVWLVALLGVAFLANSITEPWVWSELPGSAAAQYTMASIPFAKDIPGDGWVKVARGFWQFLIAVQFTLFALAVRNRFRR